MGGGGEGGQGALSLKMQPSFTYQGSSCGLRGERHLLRTSSGRMSAIESYISKPGDAEVSEAHCPEGLKL